MFSKNHHRQSATERAHIARVKRLPCSVCDADGPSDAHHIEQELHYTVIALCKECHQGATMGWHGNRVAWKVHKMDPMKALNKTLHRLAMGLE